MGLAGRDPVFYGQLDSEFAGNKPKDKQKIINTCLNCHGPWVTRPSMTIPRTRTRTSTSTGFTIRITSTAAWARDGISCAVCHHIAQPTDMTWITFLKNLINGNYQPTPPERRSGTVREDQITQYPMKSSLGINRRLKNLTRMHPQRGRAG